MLKTIKLYGVLAEKFGKQFKFDVLSTKEAMRALSVQIDGFEKFMSNAHMQGMKFTVWHDDRNIQADEVDLNSDAGVIKIVPIVEGAGGSNGLFSVIAGIALVAVGVFTFGATSAAGAALIGAGIGMAVGGIAQMLMPKVDTGDINQDGNKANIGFGGAVTTVAQGNPVPVLYGQREIGGFVVSAGQYPEDMM